MANKKKSDELARPYQLELLEAALEESTIVNLGTGSGKTFIAVMLIKELSPQIMKPWVEGSKRTVFLVTTLSLVRQQADYIKEHTSMFVGQYTGDKKLGRWPKEKWDEEFRNNHVLVMIVRVFLDLLLQGKVQFRQINLLVFDECHHAVKDHDYVQIMRRYKDSCDPLEPTRFLGLTASLIPSKCKPGDLIQKIEELERTLCCRAQTAGDLTEVAKYATNPKEDCKFFSPSNEDCLVCRLKVQLEEGIDFLEQFPKSLRETKIYDVVKCHLEDCLNILMSLGIWCAHQFSCRALEELDEYIAECGKFFNSKEEEILIHLGRTKMKLFQRDSSALTTDMFNRIHMTNKVHQLLQYLSDISDKIKGTPYCHPKRRQSIGNSDLHGIIFTERRTIALCLRDLIDKLSKERLDLQFIKCDCVVGHSDCKGGGNTYVRRETRMKVKKMEGVLSKFRQGKINLLVSTSVVEEGVDVPKCNLVVRFDFPPNLRSYIQSKGRARAKKSEYVLLIPEDEAGRMISQLQDYNMLVKELEKVCHGRHVGDDHLILEQLKDVVEPYCKNRAMATINSANNLVLRYCQNLPRDRFTLLSPNFTTTKRHIIESVTEPNRFRIPNQTEEFQTTLTLPMSSPVKHPIKGQWLPSKRLADKSAALEAVKELDLAGELDDDLCPIVRVLDSDDEENKEEWKREKSRTHAGTERAHDYYLDMVAPLLHSCLPVCGVKKNYMYMLLITDSITGNMHYSFPEQIGQLTFAIVTSTPLPYRKIPEFSIYEEEKEYNVQMVKYHTSISLDPHELDLLKVAHRTLFTHILCIRPPCLEPAFELAKKNYLVVPVQIILPEIIDGHPASAQLEAFIDMEACQVLAEFDLKVSNPDALYEPVKWPISLDRFRNAIVVTNHDAKKRLHEVVEISDAINLSSTFINPDVAPTYMSYFKKKHPEIIFKDDKQPALICKFLGTSSSYFQLLTSRFKQAAGKDIKKSDKRGRTHELFPEICSFYPIPTNLWKLTRSLPSVLWRIEGFLTVDHLRLKILHETRIGHCLDGSELTTCIKLTGYRDIGVGQLKSQRYLPGFDLEQADMLAYFECKPWEEPLRGPDNALLLQALTTKSALDCINLERLETLGDCFLKFATTVSLYCNRPNSHEGLLSNARSRLVGNFNLFFKSKKKKIPCFMLSKTFDPRLMWIPPGFEFVKDEAEYPDSLSSLPNEDNFGSDLIPEFERNYLYHKLSDKSVADSVESMIGAYLVSGGILAGLRFMDWIGINILSPAKRSGNGGKQLSSEVFGQLDSEYFLSNDFTSKLKVTPQKSHFAKPTHLKERHSDLPAECEPLLICHSSTILRDFFNPDLKLWHMDYTREENVELDRLLHIALAEKKMEQVVGWKFRNRWLLLQALTHASYTRNRLTDSYQRLEFLGDAVLDYLVTCHIYKRFPDYSPGQISCMRSALVNNISFAELTVQLRLHSFLLHASPSLMTNVNIFLENYFSHAADGDEIFYESSFLSPDDTNNLQESVPSSSSMECSKSSEDSEPEGEFEEEVEDISPPKVLGDLLESLAGAIFIDSGFSLESVWNIFQPHFDQKIASFNGIIPLAPIQELHNILPSAEMECKTEGRTIRYVISVVRKDASSLRVSARGRTKAAAKTAAAKAILRKIKKRQL